MLPEHVFTGLSPPSIIPPTFHISSELYLQSYQMSTSLNDTLKRDELFGPRSDRFTPLVTAHAHWRGGRVERLTVR